MGRVQRALVSVSDKTGLVDFCRGLHELGVHILSTGGTARAIREAGVPVTDVSAHTGSPEILDGRVKTLHPKVHGGILFIRDKQDHVAQVNAHGIEPIDMVVCNLYPFERTVAAGAVALEDAIENIDIGGPCMVRAAAKNSRDVAVLVSPGQYSQVLEELQSNNGELSSQTRFELSVAAFRHTAHYDAAISSWLSSVGSGGFPPLKWFELDRFEDLPSEEGRYECAAYCGPLGVTGGLADSVFVGGDQPSSDDIVSLLEAGSAAALVGGFCAVLVTNGILHDCVVAESGTKAIEALAAGYRPFDSCCMGVSFELDDAMALAIRDGFEDLAGIAAPRITDGPVELFAASRGWASRMRLLSYVPQPAASMAVRTLEGGILMRVPGTLPSEPGTPLTAGEPVQQILEDLEIASALLDRYPKPSVVVVKNGRMVGFCACEPDLAAACRTAVWKAGSEARGASIAVTGAGFDTAVLAVCFSAGVCGFAVPASTHKLEGLAQVANSHHAVLITHDRIGKL